MDLLTQGVLGAAFSQSACANRAQMRMAGTLGFIAGMAADLDALLRSSADPLAFLEYHRHFTHALAFIPFGGLTVAGLLYAFVRGRGLTFTQTFLYCLLGYATHGLLDACTTYGTSLLWPFSDVRVAWNIVAIVDPLATLPMIALILISLVKGKPIYARTAIAWVFVYLGLGAWQHASAVAMARDLAASRGHTIVRIDAKPSFGNILVWKTIYDTGDTFHIDAVRTGIAPHIFPGTSTQKLDTARDFPWVRPNSQQAKDIERFRFFSDGFVARDPKHTQRIIDIRYSFVPNEIGALWSIELSLDAPPDAHVLYLTHRDDARGSMKTLLGMLFGG